jgi:hypothetical protein
VGIPDKDFNVINRKHGVKGWSFLMTAIVVMAGVSRANAAAIDDIQITVSSQGCDGFAPNANSFVEHAKNNNSSRPISATFQYDSTPSSQSFQLWDANISSYTDQFPKNLVIRIAPGATVSIGCTINYRPSTAPLLVTLVPIVITVAGAAYVNPSDPNPPPEDARAFTAFTLQTGFSACGAGGKPAGLFYLLNLHPYARLTATITLVAPHGTTQMMQDIAPLSATRVGCSNGLNSPTGVAAAKLVYPPGQETSRQSKKKNLSPTFINPFHQ